ncbi:hypothetical protein EVAR_34278_1 [Eumeta japonica]|uniref:Uncharacterized protein n=1 Tax=Eumeta variegata TaxID=151549 RepID=A0A4C1VYF0_EUMVA|nr:hypothetical protein EVAR_34278_1 [Eumeta japonica]
MRNTKIMSNAHFVTTLVENFSVEVIDEYALLGQIVRIVRLGNDPVTGVLAPFLPTYPTDNFFRVTFVSNPISDLGLNVKNDTFPPRSRRDEKVLCSSPTSFPLADYCHPRIYDGRRSGQPKLLRSDKISVGEKICPPTGRRETAEAATSIREAVNTCSRNNARYFSATTESDAYSKGMSIARRPANIGRAFRWVNAERYRRSHRGKSGDKAGGGGVRGGGEGRLQLNAGPRDLNDDRRFRMSLVRARSVRTNLSQSYFSNRLSVDSYGPVILLLEMYRLGLQTPLTSQCESRAASDLRHPGLAD